MGIFDYPRLNFAGTMTLTPGTANNDDYSGSVRKKGSHENLALIDSTTVEPITFGMSDADFVKWIQKIQPFEGTAAPHDPVNLIPAEWNYYGDMNLLAKALFVGVQTGPGAPTTQDNADATLKPLFAEEFSFTGNITDINSEGSPPGTQFFLNKMRLKSGGASISGKPSKAACEWIYFTRNVNMTSDSGAGGYFYHIIKDESATLPGPHDPDMIGVVMRYYVFAKFGSENDQKAIEKIYETGGMNPAQLQITGTIAPLYEADLPHCSPVGRILQNETPNIAPPKDAKYNGGTHFALAPAIAHHSGTRLSIDFLGSFPENFQTKIPRSAGTNKMNPKYDFGDVSLCLRGSGGDITLDQVPYQDTTAGDLRGWVFDFDLSDKPEAQKSLVDGTASLHLVSPKYGDVLSENPYFIVPNQLANYAEQHGSGSEFTSQGTPKLPVKLSVFHRGKELKGSACPPIKVWSYRSTPLGYSGDLVLIDKAFQLDQPLSVDTSIPGTFLFTFSIGDDKPPATYADFIGPPFTALNNRPAISVRVLPNEDFSELMEPGQDGKLVIKDDVPFAVIYQHTLRTYDLLFPAMKKVFDLSDEATVKQQAGSILGRTCTSLWAHSTYMPITRDMSQSRRELLQAWCRKHAS